MGDVCRVVDLKSDRPTVEVARSRLNSAIAEAKKSGVAVLKVIHGYGSSGVGGALREKLRASLRHRRKEGVVREIIHGEKWNVFDERTRKLLEEYPALGRDSDLSRSNEGITVVLL